MDDRRTDEQRDDAAEGEERSERHRGLAALAVPTRAITPMPTSVPASTPTSSATPTERPRYSPRTAASLTSPIPMPPG